MPAQARVLPLIRMPWSRMSQIFRNQCQSHAYIQGFRSYGTATAEIHESLPCCGVSQKGTGEIIGELDFSQRAICNGLKVPLGSVGALRPANHRYCAYNKWKILRLPWNKRPERTSRDIKEICIQEKRTMNIMWRMFTG